MLKSLISCNYRFNNTAELQIYVQAHNYGTSTYVQDCYAITIDQLLINYFIDTHSHRLGYSKSVFRLTIKCSVYQPQVVTTQP